MQQKAQVGFMLGKFATGLVGIMGTLVSDWTSLQGSAASEMGNQFAAQFGGQFGGQFDDGIVRGGASSSAAAGGVVTRARKRSKRAAGRVRAEPSPVLPSLPSENTFLNDLDGSSSDDGAPEGPFDDSSQDNVDQYVRAPRKGKEVQVDDSVPSDDDPVLSLTLPGFTQDMGNTSVHMSPGSERVSPAGHDRSASEQMSPQRSPLADQRSPPVDTAMQDQDMGTGGDVDEPAEPADVDMGNEEPAATVVAAPRPVKVYKAKGKGKLKRLQKLGEVNNAIKSVVVDALGLTPAMMRSAMPNPKVTDVGAAQKEVPKAKKNTPKRYTAFLDNFTFLLWVTLLFCDW